MRSMDAARYYLPDLPANRPNTVVIGFSVSGEVARTIEGIEIASELGLSTLAITADPRSTLARKAGKSLSLRLPSLDLGPGMPGYSAALVLGIALARTWAIEPYRELISQAMEALPELLAAWLPGQLEEGWKCARDVIPGGGVFVGSGSCYASALYGAAKLIEIAGEYAWAQDVEEWCHLEYFCAEPAMPTILLSCDGRSASRESEMISASNAIGRNLLLSRWMGHPDWPVLVREILSPFALWAAPTAYAQRRASILKREPFCGFSGGRSQEEGGGASRIRSSRRLVAGELQDVP
jgi:glucosamine--fructose-6-phosphate aminotransferase (isomerizing)